jgi:hypothetical protein
LIIWVTVAVIVMVYANGSYRRPTLWERWFWTVPIGVAIMLWIVSNVVHRTRHKLACRYLGDVMPRGVRFRFADVGFDRHAPVSHSAS